MARSRRPLAIALTIALAPVACHLPEPHPPRAAGRSAPAAAPRRALSEWTVVPRGRLATRPPAAAPVETRLYDVQDLVAPRTVFIAPTIRGIPTGESEEPRSGAEAEERVALYGIDDLIATIKLATDPAYWDTEGGGTIDGTANGILIVRASPAMHARIGRAIGH